MSTLDESSPYTLSDGTIVARELDPFAALLRLAVTKPDGRSFLVLGFHDEWRDTQPNRFRLIVSDAEGDVVDPKVVVKHLTEYQAARKARTDEGRKMARREQLAKILGRGK